MRTLDTRVQPMVVYWRVGVHRLTPVPADVRRPTKGMSDDLGVVSAGPPRAMSTVRLGIGRGLRIDADKHHTRLLGLYELELDRSLRRLCRSGYAAFDVGGQLSLRQRSRTVTILQGRSCRSTGTRPRLGGIRTSSSSISREPSCRRCGELLRSSRGRHPHLIVAVHSAELQRDCGQWLVQRGYRPRIVSQRRFLPDHRATVHNRWLIAVGTW